MYKGRVQYVSGKLGRNFLMVWVASVACFVMLGALIGPADAAARKCFGKKVNRVISGNNKKVRLKFKDVTWVAGNRVTVIGKPYSRICADKGNQTVRPGKGRTWTDTGRGNDRIFLHKSSNKNRAYGGLGDDLIVGSKGHDFLYGGPKKNPSGAADKDTIKGLGGNDRIFDYSGEGNNFYGSTGADRIFSLGNAVSDIYGGPGSDFLEFNGGRDSSGRFERVFGEQGNDRMRGDKAATNGPAYIDGGEGDDWMYGTDAGDVLLTNSGIKKIRGNGGDDLIVTASKGLANIDGGGGTDTISYATHTPAGNVNFSGVRVELDKGKSLGQTTYQLKGLENVIGSAFDDEITGAPGQRNVIDGGIGNDVLAGQPADGDVGNGGLGTNACQGFAVAVFCNRQSPGNADSRVPLVDIHEGGVLTVIGSRSADTISVGYGNGAYRVSVPGGGIPSGGCTAIDRTTFNCPADANNLNGMLVYGNDGDDNITLENSIPQTVTTTINGGSGKNRIIGGPSKDFISTSAGNSAGSVLEGRDNFDVLYINDDVIARGGAGNDGIHATNPCVGGVASGGAKTDSLIFAGADAGVKAHIAGGYAEWVQGGCANRLKIHPTIEKLEGSRNNDHLIIGKRMKAQQGKSTLLGREGRDILDSKNGVKNTVTTGGPGARKNKVIADKKDKVVWGWGLANY
jgi:Ca2+-binding RTX toxin-like protein